MRRARQLPLPGGGRSGRHTGTEFQGRLLMAQCPGLIDTDASRPWFDDMSSAQTPAHAAASWPVQLALPVAHNATT